jgi:hypothetical protein
MLKLLSTFKKLNNGQQDLAKAFFQGIDAIKSDLTLRVVVERLEKGEIAGAIELSNLIGMAYRGRR